MSGGCTGAARASAAGSVLVVAGEASGDRVAAGIARALAGRGVRCFGMGGAACAAVGVDLVADLRRSAAAMGLVEIADRLPAMVAALFALQRRAKAERPRAAALVNYTEFNLRLGRYLRRLGIPVLWCVAPQVWAWRPGRRAAIAAALDRLAVILPFEAPLWREAGVDVRYTGHPALDTPPADRAAARARLGLPLDGTSIALLPGSRPHEIRRHALPMMRAARELARARPGTSLRLLVAASLDEGTRGWLVASAHAEGVPCAEVDPELGAQPDLAAFDAALAASGTATLETALAGAPPVIVYRASAFTAALARRFLRTPHVGLPNVLLGERRYPELLQGDVEPHRMAAAVAEVLDRRAELAASAEELRRRLAVPASHAGRTSVERMAAWMGDWLGFSDAPRAGVETSP